MSRRIKLYGSLIILLMSILVISGCTGNIKDTSVEDKKLFTATYNNDKNIYALNKEGEFIPIGEELKMVKYSKVLDKYLIIDRKDDLYTIDDNNKKELIGKLVVSYYVQVAPEGTTIYYLTKSNELYKRVRGSEYSIKIDSDVSRFTAHNDEVVTYQKNSEDGNLDLYVSVKDKESKKLSDYSTTAIANKKGDKIIFTKEKALYCYDVKTDTEEKITDSEVEFVSQFTVQFVGNKGVVYHNKKTPLNEEQLSLEDLLSYNIEYKEFGKESVTIAEDTMGLGVSNNDKGIFYFKHGEEDKGVYYTDLKKLNPVKLWDEPFSVKDIAKDGIYVSNEDNILYKIKPNGEKTRVAHDVINYPISKYKDKLAFTTANDELYLSETKIADNVKTFNVSQEALVYTTYDNKMFLLDKNNKPELIIENTKEYKDVQFNAIPIYSNKAEVEDLYGYWQQKDNPKIMLKFKEKMMTVVSEYSDEEIKFNTAVNFEDRITLKIIDSEKGKSETSRENNRNIVIIDKDNITMNDVEYKRIDEETFNKYASQEKKALQYVESIHSAKDMGEKYSCSNIFLIDGKHYFLYESDSEAPATSLIGEDGRGYIYSHLTFYNELFEDDLYNERFFGK